jgi:hypothetical protein
MTTAASDIDTITPEGTELARYRISAGERVLMGWRRGGGVEVTDRPTHGRARAYVVDRGFRCFEQLAAFVGDYVRQAERFDACPMSARAIGSVLSGSESDALEPLLERSGL